MQDIQQSSVNSGTDKAKRDAAFLQMFGDNELIWLVAETYNPTEAVWRMDFLRQGPQGTWMYYRYRYEEPTNVIYFMGTRPVEDEELPALRRKGRVFRERQT
jgi:hypothetical protein